VGIEVAVKFRAMLSIKLALVLGHAMHDSVGTGTQFALSALGSLARGS
jgi:hypothetical protein